MAPIDTGQQLRQKRRPPVVDNRQRVRLSVPGLRAIPGPRSRANWASRRDATVCPVHHRRGNATPHQRTFRNKAKTTDVLSFPLPEPGLARRALRTRTKRLRGRRFPATSRSLQSRRAATPKHLAAPCRTNFAYPDAPRHAASAGLRSRDRSRPNETRRATLRRPVGAGVECLFWAYMAASVLLALGLPVFSYLDSDLS